MDAQGAVEHRRTLLAGLAGRVLEVGAGNGVNFAHYPPAVTEVLAAAPTLSRRRTPAGTPRSPPWCCARSQIRPVPWLSSTGCCDPEGELRFLEHVRADTVGLARVQRLADHIWPTLVGGCHTSRDTLAAITTAGFEVTSLERFRFPASRLPQPAAPHVLWMAQRRPAPRPEGNRERAI